MRRDYIEFQDRSTPAGFLITFRCYGTWLHGDDRGSVDRRFYNRVGTPKIVPDLEKVARKASQLKHEPFVLDASQRAVVEEAIREVCLIRGHTLVAINVRTNHVHAVVLGAGKPERLMNAFKAYATRRLRSHGLIGSDSHPWSRHGSTRYLWTDDHVVEAADYVINGQGGDLPTFR